MGVALPSGEGDFSEPALAPGGEEEAGAKNVLSAPVTFSIYTYKQRELRRAVRKDLGMASSGFLSTSIINE